MRRFGSSTASSSPFSHSSHISLFVFSPNHPHLCALWLLTPSIKTWSSNRNAALEMSSSPWRPGQDGDHLLPRRPHLWSHWARPAPVEKPGQARAGWRPSPSQMAASLEPLGASCPRGEARAAPFSIKGSVLSSLLIPAGFHSLLSQLISVCPQSL